MYKVNVVKFIKSSAKPFILYCMGLALVIGISASAWGVEPTPPLTKQEVKALIKTANTPGDHLKLACYYREESERLTGEAKDHQEMEAAYDQNPSSHIMPKWPTMGAHCKNLEEDYTKAAKQAAEMADMHEEMAKVPRQ
ncbi:MAG: hypothetical protein M3Y72_17315 [Acidobacteriota bacterium]|nr:hypothetical protein [Acidobacteriota bacterium]